jgi:hypothetical protein
MTAFSQKGSMTRPLALFFHRLPTQHRPTCSLPDPDVDICCGDRPHRPPASAFQTPHNQAVSFLSFLCTTRGIPTAFDSLGHTARYKSPHQTHLPSFILSPHHLPPHRFPRHSIPKYHLSPVSNPPCRTSLLGFQRQLDHNPWCLL